MPEWKSIPPQAGIMLNNIYFHNNSSELRTVKVALCQFVKL